MASNRGVVYMGPGRVEVQSIDFPVLALGQRKCNHGVILKVVSTNICGSDQHMVRGRTTAPAGMVLGHEITGEVIETGPDVEFVKVGDLVSQLPRAAYRHLPQRKLIPSWHSRRCVRICRHGWLDRRAG
jgi:glutathione-independent formaldehyde dehydrogenase